MYGETNIKLYDEYACLFFIYLSGSEETLKLLSTNQVNC